MATPASEVPAGVDRSRDNSQRITLGLQSDTPSPMSEHDPEMPAEHPPARLEQQALDLALLQEGA